MREMQQGQGREEGEDRGREGRAMHRRRNLEPSLRAGWVTASHANAVIQVRCCRPPWHRVLAAYPSSASLPALGSTGFTRIRGRSPLSHQVCGVAPRHTPYWPHTCGLPCRVSRSEPALAAASRSALATLLLQQLHHGIHHRMVALGVPGQCGGDHRDLFFQRAHHHVLRRQLAHGRWH